MNINVSVQLAEGDGLAKNPDEIAEEILDIIGGDENKDSVTVHVMPTPAPPGVAGISLIPPSSEEPTP